MSRDDYALFILAWVFVTGWAVGLFTAAIVVKTQSILSVVGLTIGLIAFTWAVPLAAREYLKERGGGVNS